MCASFAHVSRGQTTKADSLALQKIQLLLMFVLVHSADACTVFYLIEWTLPECHTRRISNPALHCFHSWSNSPSEHLAYSQALNLPSLLRWAFPSGFQTGDVRLSWLGNQMSKPGTSSISLVGPKQTLFIYSSCETMALIFDRLSIFLHIFNILHSFVAFSENCKGL